MQTIHFSLQRFWLLCKKEFHEHFKNFITIQAIIFLVILTLNVITFFLNDRRVDIDSIVNSYYGLFIVGGFIYTLLSFRELKDAPGRTSFLSLPASTFEKVFTKWVFQTFVFTISMFVIYVLGYILYYAILTGMYNTKIHTFQLFTIEPYRVFYYYVISSTVVLFASAAFNNNSLLKLLLWAFGIFIAVVCFNFLLGNILFPEFRNQVFGSNDNFSLEMGPDFEDHLIFKVYKFIIQWLAPLYFLVLTYFKIKEKEV